MNLMEAIQKKPLPKELAFPESEYRRRVKRVQSLMAEQRLDLLLVSNTSNLAYLTGYDTTMPSGYTVGFLGPEGEVGLHCSELEAPCAMLSSTIREENIAVFYWYDAHDTQTQLGRILESRGYDGKRIGLEMGNPETFATYVLDARTYIKLTEMLPNATFHDATNLVMEARLIKVPAELDCMRKAGAMSAEGLNAAVEAAGEGKMDNDVAAAGYFAIVSAGSELMSIDPMVMSGRRCGYMPHIPYRRTLLKKGDSIYLEFTGTYWRYNAPSMRSISIGKPTDEVKRLAEASITCLNLLIENIRPGHTGHEVAQVAKRGLKASPGCFFHGGFGYSIGMGMQPTWTEAPMYIAEGVERALEPGMCFHLPMCIFNPGGAGVGFSESVTVTEKGCALLTPERPCELAIR